MNKNDIHNESIMIIIYCHLCTVTDSSAANAELNYQQWLLNWFQCDAIGKM